jgi:hypothetical protein
MERDSSIVTKPVKLCIFKLDSQNNCLQKLTLMRALFAMPKNRQIIMNL